MNVSEYRTDVLRASTTGQ